MSYQDLPGNGPPRSTPIPGQSTVIPGTAPGSPSPYHGVPTPGVFLGTQDVDTPPPIKQKDRNWGFWLLALLVIVPTLIGIGVAVWGFFIAKDAVDKANDAINEITIPNLSGDETGDGVSLLIGTGPADTAAALDAGILGEPTNFLEIILYPGYAFATAQDPTRPERIDRYQLEDGTIGAPMPQTNDPDATSKVFTIDAVNWSAIADLIAEAPRLATVEEGEITHVSVSRDIFTEAHDVVVRIYIIGPRNSGFIEAAPDGTVIRVVV